MTAPFQALPFDLKKDKKKKRSHGAEGFLVTPAPRTEAHSPTPCNDDADAVRPLSRVGPHCLHPAMTASSRLRFLAAWNSKFFAFALLCVHKPVGHILPVLLSGCMPGIL